MPLGLPATKEFLDCFRQDIAGNRVVPDEPPGFVKFMYERLNSVRAADIETVLGDLEDRSAWAERFMADETFIAGVLHGSNHELGIHKTMCDQLAEMIRDEVITVYGTIDVDKAADLYNGLLGHYQLFFHDVCGGRETVPFFTLNYDTAIEEATRKLGVRLVDGIVTDPESLGRVWSRTAYSEYEVIRHEVTVVLVKLHGSVRLVERQVGGESVFMEVPPNLRRNPPPMFHVVLYPSLRPKPITTEPFRTGYRLLRECLSNPHTYCLAAIGCSFWDVELNALLRDALDDNEHLHLIVVGPALRHDAIAERVGCEADRVVVIQTKFGPEPRNLIDAGKGRVLPVLRRWIGVAVDDLTSVGRFGTTEVVPDG